MKLEVGKSYVNRRGEVRVILGKTECKYPFYDAKRCYTEDGKELTGVSDALDLTAEAPEVAESCHFMPATDTQPDDGGPACNKSMREWLAGMVLAGCRANKTGGSLTPEDAAVCSLRDADALIAALKASRK